jgi:hypothetical protein
MSSFAVLECDVDRRSRRRFLVTEALSGNSGVSAVTVVAASDF